MQHVLISGSKDTRILTVSAQRLLFLKAWLWAQCFFPCFKCSGRWCFWLGISIVYASTLELMSGLIGEDTQSSMLLFSLPKVNSHQRWGLEIHMTRVSSATWKNSCWHKIKSWLANIVKHVCYSILCFRGMPISSMYIPELKPWLTILCWPINHINLRKMWNSLLKAWNIATAASFHHYRWPQCPVRSFDFLY